MSSTSSQLSVLADHPLEPWTAEVLSLLDAAFRELECPYVLVGATARDILLVHVYGLTPMRATRDVDLGVAVESWDRFTALRSGLLDRGLAEQPGILHRLLVRSAHAQHPVPVDIIPFGGIAEPGRRVAWPPDATTVMNVAAFEEARATALHIQIKAGLLIPVVSLPGLAALKLIAWMDRQNSKDASDFFQILRKYSQAGLFDRLYGNALPVLESVQFSHERAAAILLGRDVRRFSNDHTAAQLAALLSDHARLERLVGQMPDGLWDKEKMAEADDLLDLFVRGFNSRPAGSE